MLEFDEQGTGLAGYIDLPKHERLESLLLFEGYVVIATISNILFRSASTGETIREYSPQKSNVSVLKRDERQLLIQDGLHVHTMNVQTGHMNRVIDLSNHCDRDETGRWNLHSICHDRWLYINRTTFGLEDDGARLFDQDNEYRFIRKRVSFLFISQYLRRPHLLCHERRYQRFFGRHVEVPNVDKTTGQIATVRSTPLPADVENTHVECCFLASLQPYMLFDVAHLDGGEPRLVMIHNPSERARGAGTMLDMPQWCEFCGCII